MRICHVITTLGYGGAERLLVNVCSLHASHHSLDVVFLKDEPHLKAALPPGVRVHHVPLGRSCAAALRALLRELKPDVLHTHLGHADLLGQWAGRGLPLKRFTTMHNLRVKLNWKDWIIFAAYFLLFATVARHCQVICISKCVERHVRAHMGVGRRRRHVLYNAIPPASVNRSKADLRQAMGIAADAFCVLYVGRLHIQKSVDTLLRAARIARERISRLTVVLLGDGPERESLRTLARELGLEGCAEFRGAVADPEPYFAAADAFVLPSLTEGLGIVVLEAFRASLPVLATDIEGPREILQDGVNGLLVETRHPELMAGKLVRLHDDPALRDRLAAAGHADYLSKFTLDEYAKRLDALYAGL